MVLKTKEEDNSINVKISNALHCCEEFGISITDESNIDQFIGAEYLSVDIGEIIDGEYIEINIHTSQGTINIKVYNMHNGYYSHDVYIQVYDEIKRIVL